MRINSSLYYILKDHLGSASVVTVASGNILGENRYYPFGETRLSTGSILTDKLYTGQHEMAGLGIYHYQARFYSPKLGRFLSADTIVPNFANPQSLNRYSYVYNSPLNYTDPTGHDAYWCQTASCQASYYIAKNDGFFAAYGVEVDRNMTSREKLAIMVAISRTGKKIAGTRGKDETAAEAFTAIYNPITFTQTDTFDIGCVTGVNTVICADFTFENFQSDVNNVVHELGHVFNNVLGGTFADYGWTYAQPDIRNAILRPRTNGIDWQQNTLYDPTSTYATGVEMSGDMFVAWVFDAWNTDPRNTGLVDQARNTLNTNMANWLNR